MKMKLAFVAVVAAAIASSQALAAVPVAHVGKSSGKVMVNQGKGFVPLAEGAALFAGDKVFVGKDGSASIAYNDKECTVDIAPASVMQVQPTAPCAGAETVSSVDSVFIHSAQAVGGGGAAYVPVVLVGSAVVIGGTLAVAVTQDNNPVSAP